MNTILDVFELDPENRQWQITTAFDYPKKENDKLAYYPLFMIDPEENRVGFVKDNEVFELKVETKKVYLGLEEANGLKTGSNYNEVIMEDGSKFLFPVLS